jgi:hypothetical protein
MSHDIAIYLVGPSSEPYGKLQIGALGLATQAEEFARTHNLSKLTALPQVLRDSVNRIGFDIDDANLDRAVRSIQAARRGEPINSVELVVRSKQVVHAWNQPAHHSRGEDQGDRVEMPASQDSPRAVSFFLERQTLLE